MFRSGQVFARFDLGLDFFADSDDGNDTAILRIAPGIGFDGGSFAIMGEIAALAAVGGNDMNDEFTTTGAVSARFAAGKVTPYGACLLYTSDAADE